MFLWDLSAFHLEILSFAGWHDSLFSFGGQLFGGAALLAQKIENPEVLEKMQSAFQHFIKSGQAWALGIGFVFGYLFRSMTAT